VKEKRVDIGVKIWSVRFTQIME